MFTRRVLAPADGGVGSVRRACPVPGVKQPAVRECKKLPGVGGEHHSGRFSGVWQSVSRQLSATSPGITAVNRLGVEWFEVQNSASSRDSSISVRPRGTRPALPVEPGRSGVDERLLRGWCRDTSWTVPPESVRYPRYLESSPAASHRRSFARRVWPTHASVGHSVCASVSSASSTVTTTGSSAVSTWVSAVVPAT